MKVAFRTRLSLARSLRVLAGVVICWTAAGCQGAGKRRASDQEGVAVVVPVLSATWTRNFNPFLPSQSRWPTASGVYEPLIIYNAVRQEYVPWLAESYEWKDGGRELVVLVRDGVKWSDGQPFSAADVTFTWDLMRRHRALDQSGMWKKLESVTHENRTVRFRFKEPFVPGLFFVGEAPVVAAHIWGKVADPVKFRNENPVGTGPFTEVRVFKSQVYELGRNPHYWQEGRPYLDAIRMPAFPGNEQASLALIRGELDWAALFLPAIDRIFVAKNPEHHGYHFPQVEGTVMVYPNHTHAPLGDVRIRRAISHAIDRPRIVRIAMQGYTTASDATGLSDLYSKYKDPSVLEEYGDFTRFDPALAGRLFDEAGFRRGKDGLRRHPDGRPLTLDLNCVVGWSDWIIAGQIIVKNLEQQGVTARLRTYDFGAWFNRLQTGDFELALAWSSGGPTPDTFYERQMATAKLKPIGTVAEYNWQRFGSEEADALFARFAGTPDLEGQRAVARELQRVFIQNVPAIPLFPGPAWGEYNDERITGFPNAKNPYATLAPYKGPGNLFTLVELRPRGKGPSGLPTGQPKPTVAGAGANANDEGPN